MVYYYVGILLFVILSLFTVHHTLTKQKTLKRKFAIMLSCNSGYGLILNECVQCPIGTYSLGGASNCTMAPIGKKLIFLESFQTVTHLFITRSIISQEIMSPLLGHRLIIVVLIHCIPVLHRVKQVHHLLQRQQSFSLIC